MMTGLKGIFESRKATMVLIVFAGLTALLFMGKIDQDMYAYLIGGIKAFWLGAHAHEERGKMPAVEKILTEGSAAAIEHADKKDE